MRPGAKNRKRRGCIAEFDLEFSRLSNQIDFTGNMGEGRIKDKSEVLH